MIKKFKLIASAVLLVFCCACDSTSPEQTSVSDIVSPLVTQCKDPRPQICTREYMPVCATKDTGLRCITEPCPSTEQKTYATGCTACAEPKVINYIAGQCDTQDTSK